MTEDRKPVITMIGTGSENARLLAAMAGKEADTCEIQDPITQPPDIEGPHGRAWKVDLGRIKDRKPEDSGLVHWIIECPSANPIWHSYSLILIHLRPIEGHETIYHMDGATHELWLNVLDPNGDRRKIFEIGHVGEESCQWLAPSNFASQIIEVTDELALERIENAVRMICNGNLSPDTDFRFQWIKLFGNNMIKKEYR